MDGRLSRRSQTGSKRSTRKWRIWGGKVVAQYAVLGPYDFVNVVEAADNKAIAKISVELGARGTIEIMTLPVVTL
jgi:uncharacterized protein with GYD domain